MTGFKLTKAEIKVVTKLLTDGGTISAMHGGHKLTTYEGPNRSFVYVKASEKVLKGLVEKLWVDPNNNDEQEAFIYDWHYKSWSLDNCCCLEGDTLTFNYWEKGCAIC